MQNQRKLNATDDAPRSGLIMPKVPAGAYCLLPTVSLEPEPTQPRNNFETEKLGELTQSILQFGVLQPVIVRQIGKRFLIVAGERRWRAATRAGLTRIPSVIADLTESEALQVALIENIQRCGLDPIEEAEAYFRLVNEFRMTHEQIAHAVGRNRVTITNSLRLLRLPKSVLAFLSSGQLMPGHARLLLTIADDNLVERMADEVVKKNLSVKQAHARLSEMPIARRRYGRKVSPPSPAESEAIAHLQQRLQTHLDAEVRVSIRGSMGSLTITYETKEELRRLVEKLLGR